MRRGCIAVGDVRCDGCGRTIKHPERHIVISEEGDTEEKEEKMLRYCVDCCLNKGYARYEKVEKGKQVLTFFPEEIGNRP